MPQGRHETRERNGELKFIWTVIVIAIFLAIPSGASAKPNPHPLVIAAKQQHPKVRRQLAISQCRPARRAMVYYILRHNTWVRLRGVDNDPRFNFPQGCAHTLWRAKLWRAKASDARKAYLKWIDSQWALEDFKVYDGSHAWFKAIEEAQKPYPGTEAWLKSCSASEGGWGRWVPNSQGYPPGGWMQMYHSTWHSMFYGWSGNEGALRHLTRRGYDVPKSAHSWYSPLGQALASAHGYMNGRRGEWHGSGCYLN